MNITVGVNIYIYIVYKVLLNNINNYELMFLAAWRDNVSNVLCDEMEACV